MVYSLKSLTLFSLGLLRRGVSEFTALSSLMTGLVAVM